MSCRNTSSSLPDGCAALQRGRRVVGHDLAAGDDDRAGADGVDLFEDVGGDDDRLVRRHALDQRPHLMLLVRVEAVGRLVEHQDRRIMQQRLRQADAALEALGQGFDRLQAHAFQPCELQGVLHPVVQLAATVAADLGEEAQEAGDRHFRVGRRAFRAGSRGRAGRRLRRTARRGPGCARCPRSGHESGQHPHGGGFAGAVGAEEAQHLPLRDAERHVVDRGEGAEALGQSLDLDQGSLVIGRHAVPPVLVRGARA